LLRLQSDELDQRDEQARAAGIPYAEQIIAVMRDQVGLSTKEIAEKIYLGEVRTRHYLNMMAEVDLVDYDSGWFLPGQTLPMPYQDEIISALEIFSKQGGKISTAQIAQYINLSERRTLPKLEALAASGFIEKDELGGWGLAGYSFQERILERIEWLNRVGGDATSRSVARYLGVSKTLAWIYLCKLREEGYIRLISQQEGWELVRKSARTA